MFKKFIDKFILKPNAAPQEAIVEIPIEHVQSLNLNGYNFSDLPSIVFENKETLEVLYLDDNPDLIDIQGLETCTKLRVLHLYRTNIADISPLADLKELEELYIFDTLIKDISPLQNLAKLRVLDMRYTEISDISMLKHLVELEKLSLSDTKITNIDVASNFVKLKRISFDNTEVRTISSLANLEQLESIGLNNHIIDLRPIARCFFHKLRMANFGLKSVEFPPKEVVEKGHEAVLNYFQMSYWMLEAEKK